MDQNNKNIVQCINKHYYDADKYDSCPHCAAVSATDKPGDFGDTKPEYHGGKTGIQDSEVVSMSKEPLSTTFAIFKEKKEVKSKATGVSTELMLTDDGGAIYLFKEDNGDSLRDPSDSPENEIKQEPADDVKPKETKETKANGEPENKKSDLGDEKTIGFFRKLPKEETADEDSPADPVVGWLVCIRGVHFGESFTIYAGQNSIGRADGNMIRPVHDRSVSREKHATIIYDPQNREFFIKAGDDAKGLTYLNGKAVLEPKTLTAKDHVGLGNGVYLFVPLCGQDFTWEDYMGRE